MAGDKMKKSIIYALGIILLVLIIGFFMLKSNATGKIIDGSSNGDVQKIIIGMRNYNYYPNTINLKVGESVSISLDSSVSGCFRDFTIKEFGIRKYLRTPQDSVEFTPTKPGTYTFACSMGMGVGRFVVK